MLRTKPNLQAPIKYIIFYFRSSLLLGVFKTVYLFLLNHNLSKSAEVFKNECGLYSGNIDTVSSKSLLLRKCKCSKNQANQTDQKGISKSKDEWLEGTYEGGPFQMKDDQTHIFYVCDHCQQTSENRKQQNRLEEPERKKKIDKEMAQTSELVTLQSQFSDLQGEHQKLIAVTSELTTVLQMNIIGQTKNIYSVLEHCKSIYPSLFTPTSPQMPIFENTEKDQNPGFFMNNVGDSNSKEHEENEQKNENRKEERQNVEFTHNLENLSPRSPLRTPFTPETVRQILETVFEKIFELDRSKGGENVKGPILNKDEVDRIVTDVLTDLNKTPSTFCGGGEGEVSRTESRREFAVMRGETFFDVNYTKIKRDLVHSENEKKIRILQALRWRITKNDGPTRDKVMESYIANDVLDLQAGTSLPEKILTGYGNDHYVQESTCRLINTLASVRQGRDYLTMDEKLVKKVLIKKVKEIKSVTSAVIRNMLVASVQKLSIRKVCRTQMVHEGLFEVMVDYLEEFYDKLSRYCLEYCSALLMNLCLVEEAKQRSTKNPKKVIGLIRKFLEGENECCLPYVNGVMFSLLEKDEIVHEAKIQNLDKLLIRLIRITNNENIKKQLDFIVQSRLFGKGEGSVADSDEENRDEVDLLEIELDQDDFITPLPSGEKLLEEYKTDKSPHQQSVSFSTIKRDPPSSAKSFSEENKQFYHKPSGERGVFEGTKPRRYSTCSQNLIKSYVKNKRRNQSCERYPATPLCYMENCQRLNEGSTAPCTCSKCVPGQGRYTCGCFDAMCREIAEVENEEQHNLGDCSSHNMDFGKPDVKNGQSSLPKIAEHESSVKCDSQLVSATGPSEQRTSPSVKSNSQLVSATGPSEQRTIPSVKSNSQLVSATGPSVQRTSRKDSNTVIIEPIANNDNKNGGRTGSGCKVCGEKKCECAFDSRPKLNRTPML